MWWDRIAERVHEAEYFADEGVREGNLIVVVLCVESRIDKGFNNCMVELSGAD